MVNFPYNCKIVEKMLKSRSIINFILTLNILFMPKLEFVIISSALLKASSPLILPELLLHSSHLQLRELPS